ncbi:MAG: PqqD family peptide modification chaperone [bacterium]|nr:PqqD family peptide modification chaperone [bacterium]
MSTNRVIVKGLVYRKDCKMLFNPRSNTTFKLDEIATEIVEGMVEGRNTDEVAKSMSEKYKTDEQVIRQDIEDFWISIFEADTSSEEFEQEKDLGNVPTFPFNLEMALTKACDLRCSFCHDTVLPSSGTRAHMPVDKVKSLLSLYSEAGLLRIRYSGGEPTLHPNFEEILAHGKQLGLYQVVFTNGQHMTEKTLTPWKDANVGEVLISLHGSEMTHDTLTRKVGSYKKAIKAILLTLSAGIDVVVEMTMVQQNLSEIFNTIDIVKALGVKQFGLMRYVARGKDDDVFSVPLTKLSSLVNRIEQRYGGSGISVRFPCSQKFCLSEECNPCAADIDTEIRAKYLTQNCFAGLNWGSVSNSGELRLCPHSSKMFANVFEEPRSLIELWPTVIRKRVLEILAQRGETCTGCEAWSRCLGGCYLSSLE